MWQACLTNSKPVGVLVIIFYLLLPALVWSEEGCTPSPALPGAPLRLFEMPPYKMFGHSWSASSEMREYFNQQKKLLPVLGQRKHLGDGDQVVKFASVGDVMRLPPDQAEFVQPAVVNFLKQYDVALGNLETMVSPNVRVVPKSILPGEFFLMNSDPALVTALRRDDGSNLFTAFSTANNHTHDFEDIAIHDTLAFLKEQNIPQTGIRVSEDEKPYVIFERNGIRFGYYSITTFMNHNEIMAESKIDVNLLEGMMPTPFKHWKPVCKLDLEPVKQVFREMDEAAVDVKIINMHWGYEYDMYPKPKQVQLAHELAKLGTDILIGGHPHVPQPSEVCFLNGYEDNLPPEIAAQQKAEGCVLSSPDGRSRKTMIFYSLANFTSFMPGFWFQSGIVADLTIVKDDQGVSDWFAPKFTYMYNDLYHPLDGRRALMMMDDYVASACTDFRCKMLDMPRVSYLENHMSGEDLSVLDDMYMVFLGYLEFGVNFFKYHEMAE